VQAGDLPVFHGVRDLLLGVPLGLLRVPQATRGCAGEEGERQEVRVARLLLAERRRRVGGVGLRAQRRQRLVQRVELGVERMQRGRQLCWLVKVSVRRSGWSRRTDTLTSQHSAAMDVD